MSAILDANKTLANFSSSQHSSFKYSGVNTKCNEFVNSLVNIMSCHNNFNECVVCFNDFTLEFQSTYEPLVVICGHTFCRTCCEQFNYCPYCNTKLENLSPNYAFKEILASSDSYRPSKKRKEVIGLNLEQLGGVDEDKVVKSTAEIRKNRKSRRKELKNAIKAFEIEVTELQHLMEFRQTLIGKAKHLLKDMKKDKIN